MSSTNGKFQTINATGEGWRDTVSSFIKKYKDYSHTHSEDTILFLYITDNLSKDCNSIITLISSVLEIDNIFGTVSPAIFKNSNLFTNEDAIVGMFANFNRDHYFNLPLLKNNIFSEDLNETSNLNSWLSINNPMLLMLHMAPSHENYIDSSIKNISSRTKSFLAGGVTISRYNSVRFVESKTTEDSATGIVFSDKVKTYSLMSQGCNLIGSDHIITSCEGNIIEKIDNRNALDVLLEDVEQYKNLPSDLTDDYLTHQEGEVQIAFPIKNNDYNDFYVRSIISADNNTKTITLGKNVSNGEAIRFVYRDSEIIKNDLTSDLISLKERIKKENGEFSVKGGIYISCIGRSVINEDQERPIMENEIIENIIGKDVPIIGHYASGEISNENLYGFTGLLILFG